MKEEWNQSANHGELSSTQRDTLEAPGAATSESIIVELRAYAPDIAESDYEEIRILLDELSQNKLSLIALLCSHLFRYSQNHEEDLTRLRKMILEIQLKNSD